MVTKAALLIITMLLLSPIAVADDEVPDDYIIVHITPSSTIVVVIEGNELNFVSKRLSSDKVESSLFEKGNISGLVVFFQE